MGFFKTRNKRTFLPTEVGSSPTLPCLLKGFLRARLLTQHPESACISFIIQFLADIQHANPSGISVVMFLQRAYSTPHLPKAALVFNGRFSIETSTLHLQWRAKEMGIKTEWSEPHTSEVLQLKRGNVRTPPLVLWGITSCGTWRRKQDGAHTQGVTIRYKTALRNSVA